MPTLILYLVTVFIFLLFLISITIYTLFLIYSFIAGSPYVSTKTKEIDDILREANLKKGRIFFDLGCGDGRLVRRAVKNYQVKGFGVDVNPLLVYQAKLLAKVEKIDHQINFYRKNIFDTDLRNADYIYIFLLPALIRKLTPKFNKELKKGAFVISHGFKIEGSEDKLVKILPRSPFSTYFYRF